MLFNFQPFFFFKGDFFQCLSAVDFLFNLVAFIEILLCDLNSLKCVEVCFKAQNMVYVGECFYLTI